MIKSNGKNENYLGYGAVHSISSFIPVYGDRALTPQIQAAALASIRSVTPALLPPTAPSPASGSQSRSAPCSAPDGSCRPPAPASEFRGHESSGDTILNWLCALYASPTTPGYLAPFSNPARCAPLDAAIATVSATLFATVFRSLKSTCPIASPTR